MAVMNLTRSPTSSVLRIRVATGLASGLGALLSGVLFLSALFSQSRVLGQTALVVLALSLVGMGATQGWQAYLLFEKGSGTTVDGQPTLRSEQPARPVVWIALLGLLAATHGVVAAFLIWIAVFSGR
jgi:hypothetical protein